MICHVVWAKAPRIENTPKIVRATMIVRLRPKRSPAEPSVMAPRAMPIVLAVITHVMSVAAMPKSAAIEEPMKAIDWVSNPSSRATTKHRSTISQRRLFIGRSSMTC